MKLFVKIFLWFLAAVALMVGVIIFVTRTFQTDPMFSRTQRSTRSQMTVYGGTASQIVKAEGEGGLRIFLSRLRDVEPPREVQLVSSDGTPWFGEVGKIADSQELIGRTFANGIAETDFSGVDAPAVTMRSPAGTTPLHVAALRGDRNAVRLLLDAGADSNAVGEGGCTPLHEALKHPHLQVARMLVAAGGQLDAKNRDGVSPREMARSLPLWESEN